MKIPIDEITVRPGRRETVPGIIMDLAESMAEVGLLNPVTVSADHVLIAGLHRLEAAKSLGWTEIECNVCDLEDSLMKLAEIDENCVRTNMTTLERNGRKSCGRGKPSMRAFTRRQGLASRRRQERTRPKASVAIRNRG